MSCTNDRIEPKQNKIKKKKMFASTKLLVFFALPPPRFMNRWIWMDGFVRLLTLHAYELFIYSLHYFFLILYFFSTVLCYSLLTAFFALVLPGDLTLRSFIQQ